MFKKCIFVVLLVSASLATEHKIQDCPQSQHKNICGSFPPTCQRSRYRSYDGSCNNLENPQWGSAFSAYDRFIPDSYSDGVHDFPRSTNNEPLKNPRDVSLMVFPDVLVKSSKWNVITLQWGQVVAHDMSFTADVPQTGVDDIICCINGEPIPPRTSETDPRCKPIPLPKDDPYNAPEGNTCINFYRTLTNKNQNCSVPGKTEQTISGVTSYHDLSIVYGSSEKQAKKVRALKNGKLAFVERNGQTWLPQDSNVTFACNNVRNAQEPCYYTGDIRVNQNPQLALLQNALMRAHNLIAEKLCGVINRHWGDEKCFQETRRILIAIAQHITYYEFLHIFLGDKNVVEKGLTYPKAKDFTNDYNPKINAQTLNEHATAAFRFYHTEIVGQLKMFSKSRKFTGQIRLSDWFGRPSVIENKTSELTRGLCTQPQNEVDRYFDSEITQFFFRPPNASLGQDLRAIDVQRSRDHGVGTYVAALIACNLSYPTSFKDLEKYISRKKVELLKRVYSSVYDVELAVAGALEKLVPGTLAGPTFLCIMLKQFYRTRVGDRYFFENGNTDGAFTKKQLKSIKRGGTMARLLCDTVKEVKLMQPDAFKKISKKNSLVNCNRLPQVDLTLWKEDPKKPSNDIN